MKKKLFTSTFSLLLVFSLVCSVAFAAYPTWDVSNVSSAGVQYGANFTISGSTAVPVSLSIDQGPQSNGAGTAKIEYCIVRQADNSVAGTCTTVEGNYGDIYGSPKGLIIANLTGGNYKVRITNKGAVSVYSQGNVYF